MTATRRPVYLSQTAVEASPMFLEVGHLEAADDAGTREVSGLALPYGEDLERMDWLTGATRQRFALDSAVVRPNAAAFYGHDHLDRGLPVGRITSSEHTPAGLRVTVRLSATPKGDEVYTLLRDGVLDRFSIGFYSLTSHLEDADAVLVHDEVDVFEVSVVLDPAYQSAVVDSVLSNPTRQPARTNPSEGTAMTPEQRARLAALRAMTTLSAAEAGELSTLSALEAANPAGGPPTGGTDVAALASSVETLERQIATFGDTLQAAGPAAPPVPIPGNSYGEFLQMAARGDAAATQFLEYVGGVIGDLGDWVQDTWVGDIVREVNVNRTALTFFDSAPLPATGMGVEYGRLLEDTVEVAEQLAEGDELAYGKIKFDTDTARLRTYGGWGELSRQQIERSAMQVVDRFFRALLRRYSRVTENAVRVPLAAAVGAKSIAATNLTTSDGWIDFLVDAAVHFDDKGLAPEVAFLGKTAFKNLAKLRDGDNADAPRLLSRDSGTVNVLGLTGSVYSLRFQMLGNLPATAVRVCHSEAIKSFEASGAPWRLQDGDITKLTEAQSIYGYMAVALQEPDLIVVPGA